VSFSDHLATLYPDMDREQVCRDHLWTGTILPAVSQDQAALLERATEAWTNKKAAARNSAETAQRASAVFKPQPTLP
ncbi:MAG: hypothetical protein KDJ75_08655, partial [Alphaproteobacteria bacterium]|nr:hypothetical protein [Alphaproteobacteria bacterium]